MYIQSVLFQFLCISWIHSRTSHSLACTFYEFVKVCRWFYATNENIHVLSVKFSHLFLRPEIIITFVCVEGGGVRHRSPRNSGSLIFSCYSSGNHMFCVFIRIHKTYDS